MSFTLLPGITPWAVGFLAVAAIGLVIAVLALVDVLRPARTAGGAPRPTRTPARVTTRRSPGHVRPHHA